MFLEVNFVADLMAEGLVGRINFDARLNAWQTTLTGRSVYQLSREFYSVATGGFARRRSLARHETVGGYFHV